jgi:uncharacterized membrane protein YhaH (DUF805 family)
LGRHKFLINAFGVPPSGGILYYTEWITFDHNRLKAEHEPLVLRASGTTTHLLICVRTNGSRSLYRKVNRNSIWLDGNGMLRIKVIISIIALGFVVIDSLLLVIYTLAVIVPGLAVTVRRLHDTGRSGWWIFIALVPLVGIVLLGFEVQDSTPGENLYGKNPKGGHSLTA